MIFDIPLQHLHSPHVTSDLVHTIKLAQSWESRDGRVNPNRRYPKSFVSRILVSKFFDIRILQTISR